MSITLEQFRKNADIHGVCGMSKLWDSCKTKKQLIDLALDIKGIMYISKAMADGWGISADELCKEFGNFLNGKYIHSSGLYTSSMVMPFGNEQFSYLKLNTTCTMIINYTGYIESIGGNEIHLVNCNCYIDGGKYGTRVYTYGKCVIDGFNFKTIESYE